VADHYSTLASDTLGDWSVELHSDSPTGAIIETRRFTLTYKARISGLSASDGRNVDSTIAVSASVRNLVSREVTGTTLTYLVWWDGNGDGVYNEGDTYIDTSGTPLPYSADATTHVSAIGTIAPEGAWTEPAPWSMSNTRFPNQGTYIVTATWRDANGTIIDQKSAQFFSVPALGWPLFLLAVGIMGFVAWRRRGTPLDGAALRSDRRSVWSEAAARYWHRVRRAGSLSSLVDADSSAVETNA
jgi:hypothetical protein